MIGKKPKIGYQNKPKKKSARRKSYISSLFIHPKNKVSLNEKVIKFFIYISLKLVIRPKKWKYPKKNYEIIDRTYKRIISADFIYIPSSIAFYLIMAFMPILSLITFLYLIPHFDSWLRYITNSPENSDPLADVIGKFIPGVKDLIKQVRVVASNNQTNAQAGAYIAAGLSLLISTFIAAGGFAKLVFTQSYIYDHKFVGGYWMNKIKGMIMVVVFTAFLFIALTMNVIISATIDSSSISNVLKKVINHTWLIIGLAISIFIGMTLLFKFSPRYKVKFREIIPGAVVTTIPSLAFLALFGSISSLWSYGQYGAVGTVMYVGMASLIITYFIFIGLIANAAYYKTFIGDKVPNKWTFSNK